LEERQDSSSDEPQIEWESTDLQAAVKISEFSKIHAMRGRHLEDPIKEISTMQLLGNYHPHVLGAFDVLQDDNFLYTITRYLPGGELYGRLEEGFPRRKRPDEELDGSDGYTYDESKARAWFKQLVMVSLQERKHHAFHCSCRSYIRVLLSRVAGFGSLSQERGCPSGHQS
jgi:serine/threonine protein kinase